MDEVSLTPEQEAEAQRIEDNPKAAATVEIRRIARVLASKDNRHLFGETEFQVRDAVHRIAPDTYFRDAHTADRAAESHRHKMAMSCPAVARKNPQNKGFG